MAGGAWARADRLEGSAAVDAENLAACRTTHHRGFIRGATCDIGAFQRNAPPVSGAFGRALARR